MAPGIPALAFARWPQGGLLIGGVGVGDGGHADQVHRDERGADDEGAGEFGHGYLRVFDRSTDVVWMIDGRLGSGGWPADQLPPAAGPPPGGPRGGGASPRGRTQVWSV